MKPTLLLIVKFITYLKIIIVCFINDLLNNHVLDLIEENNKRALSNNRSSHSSNNNNDKSNSPLLSSNDNDDFDSRARSLPSILGDGPTDIPNVKVSPSGPSFPCLTTPSSNISIIEEEGGGGEKKSHSNELKIGDDDEDTSTIQLHDIDYEDEENDNISIGITDKSAPYKVNALAIINMIMLIMMRYGYHKTSYSNQKINSQSADKMNVVIIPAILTAVDYTICENYPIITRFLKNIVLLEVYGNLTAFNFNTFLKFAVWLVFLSIYLSTIKFNDFAKKTLNNLETHNNFKLFQVSLNGKFVLFRFALFGFLLIFMPLVTLVPLLIILKMIIAIAQVINLRFEKQDDPYHIFKICLTIMTWVCSVTVFGEPSYAKFPSQNIKTFKWFRSKNDVLWASVVFIIKRICLIMACKYFALLALDYKLTLVPIEEASDDMNLHFLKTPINLFKNKDENENENEKVIAKCDFIESNKIDSEFDDEEGGDVRSQSNMGVKQDDFSAVVFLTNKRLIKWTNDGYRNVTRDTFKKFSWNFFMKKFYGRELEIKELFNFKEFDINLDHGFFNIGEEEEDEDEIDLIKKTECNLLISSCKKQFAWIHYAAKNSILKMVYFDLTSDQPSIKQFDFNDLVISDIAENYFFQEGPLGQDPAQAFVIVLKSAEIIEINLIKESVSRKKLPLVQNIDHWIRLKTDRLAERCIIYDTSKKYIGHYVKFRGWKILPFPMDTSQLGSNHNNNINKKKHSLASVKMGQSKSMMINGGSGMMNNSSSKFFKMAPMLHQNSEPLTRLNPMVGNNIKKETILKIDSLEHLGFICQVSDGDSNCDMQKNSIAKWNIKLIECSSGKIMKTFSIDSKNVILDSIRITHERDLKFCGFCGFLSCKKIHLHYLVKQEKQHNSDIPLLNDTSDYKLVVLDLVNNRVKNVKKQRICFRIERDEREVRCYGLNNSVEFKKIYKLNNCIGEPIFNSFNDEYCFIEASKKKNECIKDCNSLNRHFVKINLETLGNMVYLPIDKCSDMNINHLESFDNFKYNIPKPSTDEEIRRTDLQELENDIKEIGKNNKSLALKLKYLYNPADGSICYYY